MKKISFLTLSTFLALLPLLLFLWLSTPARVAAGACSVPGDHPTIQGAVNDNTCNIINVAANTYNENVVISRTLAIVGAGPGSTIVNGGTLASVFTVQPGLSVTLESLTIMNGANLEGAGLFNDGSQLMISNTHILSNSAALSGGGLHNQSGNVTFVNSQIRQNLAATGAGIYSIGHITLTNSDLLGNLAGDFGGGIYNIGGTVDFADGDISSNAAGMSGGGIYNFNGAVQLNNSRISDNSVLVVNGGGIYQAFISATLQIANSDFERNSAPTDGGGIYNSGGTTTIHNTTFLTNEAGDRGGGLANDAVGQLTLLNSQFISNTAEALGGGLYSSGTITVGQTLFQGNSAVNQTFTAGSGGGVFNEGSGTVTGSILRDNSAYNNGGGLANSGTLLIEQTTLHDNQTIAGTGSGGGIGNSGSLTVRYSTVSNNTAMDGGGLYNGSSLTLVNSTISTNSANGCGGLQNRGPAVISFTTFVSNSAIAGGGILAITDTVNLNSTIIAGNLAGGDCQTAGGAIVSQNYNLDSDNTCNLIAANDQPGTLPLLGPLQDNGGLTPTHALLPGSPAINTGDNANCPAGDQRGFPRPIGPACDIGAYEAGIVSYLPVIRKA